MRPSSAPAYRGRKKETPFEKLRLLGMGILHTPINSFILETLLSPLRLRVAFFCCIENESDCEP